MRAQACTSCRRIRLDGISLVQQTFLVKLLQQPPQSFNVTVIVGNVRIFQVYPVTHLMGKVSPFFRELHDIRAAMLVVVCHRNRFTDILFGNSKCLFHSQFHRKSVCVPSCFTLHLETFHGLETTECILNCTCHHVVNTRHTVSRGRTFVEHERRIPLTFCHTFREHIVFIPFFQHLLVYF